MDVKSGTTGAREGKEGHTPPGQHCRNISKGPAGELFPSLELI